MLTADVRAAGTVSVLDWANSGSIVKLENYETILYAQPDGGWVAEVPAIPGCYALMPTREEAVRELGSVFQMIAEEFREFQKLP
jgi:predicted RNase H-like HicB family nuclease